MPDGTGGLGAVVALGRQPDLWAGGMAGVVVADWVMNYEDSSDLLRGYQRMLFRGDPEARGDAMRAGSPLTYVDAVRAPVLLLAGLNDPRCPLRQVENYARALRERGKVVELYQYGAGHGSHVADERVRQMRVQLDFVRRHLGLPG